MSEYSVEFEVHIDMPDWLRNLSSFNPPTYRIYADNELMNERTYDFYKTREYLVEMLKLDLAPGVHTISIHQTSSNLADVKLTMKNLSANNSNSSITAVQDTAISFRSR